MALIKDYELPGTGLVVSNAYHVVTDVNIKKRMAVGKQDILRKLQ